MGYHIATAIAWVLSIAASYAIAIGYNNSHSDEDARLKHMAEQVDECINLLKEEILKECLSENDRKDDK